MDRNPQRHCSVPGIPFVREWVERYFGDLCEVHDDEYLAGKCRVCRDIKFTALAVVRCLPFIAALVLLPLVFLAFQINTVIERGREWI